MISETKKDVDEKYAALLKSEEGKKLIERLNNWDSTKGAEKLS